MIYLWQLPQNLLGLLVLLCTRARKVGEHYEYNLPFGSVSLGRYIFLGPAHWHDAQVLSHETGHSKQSKYLGPLYLLAIGLPSFLWAAVYRYSWKRLNKRGITYHWFYTEKWADHLGGVER